MRAAVDLVEMAGILAGLGLLGYPIVARVPRLSRAELAAWSWTAGLILLAVAEGALLLLGVRPGAGKLAPLLVVLAIALRGRGSFVSRPRTPLSTSDRIAAALALALVALFAIQAVSEPMWAWDYVAIWGLKGKTLFLGGGLPDRFFRDTDLRFAHPGYPLLLPVVLAGVSTLAGTWDPQALALLYPAFELATLLVLWGFLRRRCESPAGAGIAVVLAAGYFPLYQTFLVGLGEIPIALGYVLAGSALLDSFETGGREQWRLLLLSAVFCSSLKNEGAVFLLLLAGAAALRFLRRKRSSAAAVAVFGGIPFLAVLALRLWARPVAADFQWTSLAARGAAEAVRRFPAVAAYFRHDVLRFELPFLLGLAGVFVLSRPGVADVLLVPVALLVALYAVAPLFSSWSDPVVFARSTFVRISGALVPVLLLALGARVAAAAELFSLRFFLRGPTMK